MGTILCVCRLLAQLAIDQLVCTINCCNHTVPSIHKFSPYSCGSICFYSFFSTEIPDFLSEEECRVVMQLAQLKGLMESQLMMQEGQEELVEELNLSPEDIFNLLDINQDGQLQLHEVYVSLWTVGLLCVTLVLVPEVFKALVSGSSTDIDSFPGEGRHLAHTRESARNLCRAQS